MDGFCADGVCSCYDCFVILVIAYYYLPTQDVSANKKRLDLLKKELAELEEKVRTTKKLIQAEETSIANSEQETQEIAEQIQVEFAEISTLSRQIVTGDDKDDEAIIAQADSVRTEAIHAIEEFLNQ